MKLPPLPLRWTTPNGRFRNLALSWFVHRDMRRHLEGFADVKFTWTIAKMVRR